MIPPGVNEKSTEFQYRNPVKPMTPSAPPGMTCICGPEMQSSCILPSPEANLSLTSMLLSALVGALGAWYLSSGEDEDEEDGPEHMYT